MNALPGPIPWIDAWLQRVHPDFVKLYGKRLAEYCVILPGQHGYGLTVVFRRHGHRVRGKARPKKNRRYPRTVPLPEVAWRQLHEQPTMALLDYCSARTATKQISRTAYPREFMEQYRACDRLPQADQRRQYLMHYYRPLDRIEVDFGPRYYPATLDAAVQEYRLREAPFLRNMFTEPLRGRILLEMDTPDP